MQQVYKPQNVVRLIGQGMQVKRHCKEVQVTSDLSHEQTGRGAWNRGLLSVRSVARTLCVVRARAAHLKLHYSVPFRRILCDLWLYNMKTVTTAANTSRSSGRHLETVPEKSINSTRNCGNTYTTLQFSFMKVWRFFQKYHDWFQNGTKNELKP